MKNLEKIYLSEIKTINPLSHEDICKAYDEGRLDKIIESFQPFIWRLCYDYQSIAKTGAIDLVGSASLGLFNGLKNYNPHRTNSGSIVQYCYKYITYEITKRCLDELGTTRHYHYNGGEYGLVYNELAFDDLQEEEDFVKKIHDEFEIELILDMLSILNEQERLVIDWVFIQNKPIKGLESHLNKSNDSGSLSAIKKKALDKLRFFYERYKDVCEDTISLIQL